MQNTPPQSQPDRPPHLAAPSGAALVAVEQALALATELAPLLATADGLQRCYDTLVGLCVSEGMVARFASLRGRRLARLDWPAAVGSAPAGRHIGAILLAAHLRSDPAWKQPSSKAAPEAPSSNAAPPAPGQARLVPTGLWGGVLSVANALAFAQRGRLAVLLEVDDPSAEVSVVDAATLLGGCHAAVAGDGGVPYRVDDQMILPITTAQRAARWLEFEVTRETSDQTDLSLADEEDAIATLISKLAALPPLPLRCGPLAQAILAGHGLDGAAIAATERAVRDFAQVSGEALRNEAPQPGALEVGVLRYLRATMRGDLRVTHLSAGARPDRGSASARALLDLRMPPDQSAADAEPALATLRTAGASLRDLAGRHGVLGRDDDPARVAVARAAAAFGLTMRLAPALAARDHDGLPWRTADLPVIGFAPVWIAPTRDGNSELRHGSMPTDDAGLRWGATLYAAVAGRLDGGVA